MTVTRIPLDGVAASTNLTGATVANLDEDADSSGTDWATATSATAQTQLRATFGAIPSKGVLRSGAGLQEFRVQLRKTTGTPNPTVDIDLYENGSLVTNLVTGTSITSTSEQVVAATFNAASMTDATLGSNTEIRITGNVGTGQVAGAMPALNATAGTLYTSATMPGTFDVNVPAHSNGDLLILVVLMRNTNNDGSLDSINTGGWTQLGGAGNEYGGAQNARMGVGWKLGNGSESAVNITTSGGTGTDRCLARVYRVTAADGFAATPVQNVGSAVAGTADPQTLPQVTTPSANCLAFMCHARNSNTSVAAPTGESGGDWVEPVAESTATNGGIGVFTANMASAGTISGGTADLGASANYVGIAFAIVPANVTSNVNTVEIGAIEWNADHLYDFPYTGVGGGASAGDGRSLILPASLGSVFTQDTFTRVVAADGGWGTNDAGQAWGVSAASFLSVNGASAVFTPTTGSSRVRYGRLAYDPASADYEVLVLWSSQEQGVQGFFIGLRQQADSGANGYFLGWQPASTEWWSIIRRVSSADTEVAQATTPQMADNEKWFIRAKIMGTNPVKLYLKAWREDQAEPAAWTTTYDDTDAARIQTTGRPGFRLDAASTHTGLNSYVHEYVVLEAEAEAETFLYTGAGGASSGGSATTLAILSHLYTGAGGAASGGVATTYPVLSHLYTGSGGATAGGIATIGHIWARTGAGGAESGGAATTLPNYVFLYTGSGGATADGTATIGHIWARIGSGGAESGGTAGIVRTYAMQGSGGATAGGTAAVVTTKVMIGAGGAASGGTAGIVRTWAPTGSGGAESGGQAATSYEVPGANIYSYQGVGGATSGGSAGLARVWVRDGAGGASASGAATVARTYVPPTSGGAAAAGTATVARTYSPPSSGGATSGGQATTSYVPEGVEFAYTGVGGAASGGAATTLRLSGWRYTGAGGAASGGTATVNRDFAPTGSGGATAGGSAPHAREWARTGSGGASSGGAATIGRIWVREGSGGAVSGGAATTRYTPGITFTPGAPHWTAPQASFKWNAQPVTFKWNAQPRAITWHAPVTEFAWEGA